MRNPYIGRPEWYPLDREQEVSAMPDVSLLHMIERMLTDPIYQDYLVARRVLKERKDSGIIRGLDDEGRVTENFVRVEGLNTTLKFGAQ